MPDANLSNETNGGIDLNVNEEALVEQGDKIKFSIPQGDFAKFKSFQADGFTPVIIKIAPPKALSEVLGLSENDSVEQTSQLMSSHSS